VEINYGGLAVNKNFLEKQPNCIYSKTSEQRMHSAVHDRICGWTV